MYQFRVQLMEVVDTFERYFRPVEWVECVDQAEWVFLDLRWVVIIVEAGEWVLCCIKEVH
jgi:hypothetical protein